jgi:hypothetical protein
MARKATLDEYQETDYQQWLKDDVWSQDEASHLLNGIKPTNHYFFKVGDELVTYPDDVRESVKNTLGLIEHSSRTGVLKRESGNNLADNKYPHSSKFYPKTYIEWAIRKELDIPQPLLYWYEKQQKPVGRTSTAKKTLPEFSINHRSELLDILQETIAEFWESHNKKTPPKQSVILKWLAEKYPYLTTKEIKAIELIIRPNRNKRGQKQVIKYR